MVAAETDCVNTSIKPPYATNVFRARFYCALLQHVSGLFDSPDYGTCLYIADSTDPLTYTVVTLNIFFVYILPEDGHRSGPKHVVVHNKIEHEKHLLRTVV
jgi:hypothetical protein